MEYGSFDIITLDKFTHRLVRTYAIEFKLPYNFEVVIDPEDLLNETVDSIIEEVGTVKILSKLLLEFSLNKVLNDKDVLNIINDCCNQLSEIGYQIGGCDMTYVTDTFEEDKDE